MKIAVAFCSMTWWASSELIISESKHFVAKGMSLYVQLLKAKGHFVARENSPYVKVVEGHFGKNGAQQLHSIAPSLWIIFVTYRVRVTTSPLKFDGGSEWVEWVEAFAASVRFCHRFCARCWLPRWPCNLACLWHVRHPLRLRLSRRVSSMWG